MYQQKLNITKESLKDRIDLIMEKFGTNLPQSLNYQLLNRLVEETYGSDIMKRSVDIALEGIYFCQFSNIKKLNFHVPHPPIIREILQNKLNIKDSILKKFEEFNYIDIFHLFPNEILDFKTLFSELENLKLPITLTAPFTYRDRSLKAFDPVNTLSGPTIPCAFLPHDEYKAVIFKNCLSELERRDYMHIGFVPKKRLTYLSLCTELKKIVKTTKIQNTNVNKNSNTVVESPGRKQQRRREESRDFLQVTGCLYGSDTPRGRRQASSQKRRE